MIKRYLRFLPIMCASVLLLGACARIKLQRKHHYMERTYAALKERLNEAEVVLIEDSVKVLFRDNVMFDFDMAYVRPEFLPVLNRFGGILNDFKETGILIIGHTDSVGGDNQRNVSLSRRRADSTRTVLQYDGVDINRMNSWGLGSRLPVATNATADGRMRNRRVEFVVLYNYRNKEPK